MLLKTRQQLRRKTRASRQQLRGRERGRTRHNGNKHAGAGQQRNCQKTYHLSVPFVVNL